MLGEKVCVLTRSKTGEDSMGEPVYEWMPQIVENVLVKPSTGQDLDDDLRPDGVRVEYTLAFPKSFSEKSLRGARIALLDRGMEQDANTALRVSGSPDVTNPCPTNWNMLVEVGRVDG